MNVYLIDARHLAMHDEYEGWVVIAESPEQAWRIAFDSVEFPDELPSGMHSATPATLDDLSFEKLGTSTETEPRLILSAFRSG